MTNFLTRLIMLNSNEQPEIYSGFVHTLTKIKYAAVASAAETTLDFSNSMPVSNKLPSKKIKPARPAVESLQPFVTDDKKQRLLKPPLRKKEKQYQLEDRRKAQLTSLRDAQLLTTSSNGKINNLKKKQKKLPQVMQPLMVLPNTTNKLHKQKANLAKMESDTVSKNFSAAHEPNFSNINHTDTSHLQKLKIDNAHLSINNNLNKSEQKPEKNNFLSSHIEKEITIFPDIAPSPIKLLAQEITAEKPLIKNEYQETISKLNLSVSINRIVINAKQMTKQNNSRATMSKAPKLSLMDYLKYEGNKE